MYSCVFCFSTSCFPLGSFVCSHGTFKDIFLLHYSWLTLHPAIQSSSIYSYPKVELLLTLIFSLINSSPAFSCFCCSILFLFVWCFPPQMLKNSLWKHHMKRWWLRSHSRSGHVWISNSYSAGLPWKICPECSIFQWVSWLITRMLSVHHIKRPCPQHWVADWGSRRDIPLV